MAVLEAPPALKQRHQQMRREGLDAFLEAVHRPRRAQPRLPAGPPPERLGDPNVQLAEKPVEAVKASAPPFNTIIGGAVLRFAKQLGSEDLFHLEALYKLNARGMHSKGLTASYSGVSVDSSRTTYQHLSASQSDAHELLRRVLKAMPPELRRLTQEMVLDELPKRELAEVGRSVTGFEDARRNLGAVVAILRVIAWITRDNLR